VHLLCTVRQEGIQRFEEEPDQEDQGSHQQEDVKEELLGDDDIDDEDDSKVAGVSASNIEFSFIVLNVVILSSFFILFLSITYC